MSKIFLNCIYRNNFGDDLLIKTICEHYPSDSFYLINYESKSEISLSNNLYVIKCNYFFYRIVRKFFKTFFKSRNIIDTCVIKKCNYVITLGGSLFMQSSEWKPEKDYNKIWYSKLNKPYFVIGSNIGPVYSSQYIDFLKKYIFKNAEKVCLRDKKSCEYIGDIKSTAYCGELVFSYDVDKYRNLTSEKKVFISLINIDKKKNQMTNPNVENYRFLIEDIIKYFMNLNYKIQLVSLCDSEGDLEEAIYFYNLFGNDSNISIINYKHNVDEIIEQIATSSVVIGSRFHANVLGFLLKKCVIPISYNDKTINLLKDISFRGLYFDANDLGKQKSSNISNIDLTYRCDISRQIENAKKYYEILDNYLESRK